MPVLDLSPEKPKPGDLADANAISNAFTKIESVVNDLDDTNFASGTPIDPSSIAPGGAVVGDVLTWNGSAWVPGGGVPAGTILPFVSGTPPNGYFVCDGSLKAKGSYGALYNALRAGAPSSPWGEDTGNFNLPNLKGRIPVGYDASQAAEFSPISKGSKAGDPAGEKLHTLLHTETAVPNHSHSMDHDHPLQMRTDFGTLPTTGVPMASNGGAVFDNGGGGAGAPVKMYNGPTGPIWGGNPLPASAGHNNLQPYVVVSYIIKY